MITLRFECATLAEALDLCSAHAARGGTTTQRGRAALYGLSGGALSDLEAGKRSPTEEECEALDLHLQTVGGVLRDGDGMQSVCKLRT